jgi:hypothetical protein
MRNSTRMIITPKIILIFLQLSPFSTLLTFED